MFFSGYDALAVKPYPLTDEGAIQAYRDVTRSDPFPGEWEPDDTGSDGLSMAKLLVSKGAISGFTHAFSIGEVLAGLMSTPCIVGTEWTDGMFNPDGEGIVHPTGAVAGGHEYVCDGYEADRRLVWFTNSWGADWGKDGRHAMHADEFAELLSRNGDATFFVPSDRPAPTPTPVPELDADRVLAGAVGDWARRDASSSTKTRRALRVWLEAKGL